jgi:signal peptidase I
VKHRDEPAWRQVLRSVGVWTWMVVYIGLLPAALSVVLNVLAVRQGYLEGIAPWQLLLGFALLAYGAYGIREHVPLWRWVANEPGYRRRQIRRHATQVVRLARRALGRPWYRRRLSEATAIELREAVDAVRKVLKDRKAATELHAPLERLEALFDRNLGFMKFSVYVEYGGQIGLAVLAAFVLRESVVEAFKIPSGSMLPTLEVGDHIFVNKLEYGVRFPFTDWLPLSYGSPARGDVVVFAEPHKGGDDFIKRVVAVAGDRVEVEPDGTLRINGRTVRRCSLGTIRAPIRDDPRSQKASFDLFVERLGGVQHVIRQLHDPPRSPAPTAPGRSNYRDLGGGLLLVTGGDMPGRPYPRRGSPEAAQGGFIVPPDRVFVMGDNRDNSNDSRFWGTVPLGRIKGKAKFIWWSNADRSVETERIGISIHDDVQIDGRRLTDEQRRCLADLSQTEPGAP